MTASHSCHNESIPLPIRVVECPECTWKGSSCQALGRHRAERHAYIIEQRRKASGVKCLACSYNFHTRGRLQNHLVVNKGCWAFYQREVDTLDSQTFWSEEVQRKLEFKRLARLGLPPTSAELNGAAYLDQGPNEEEERAQPPDLVVPTPTLNLL